MDILIGGLVSLVSALAVISLQHILSMRKLITETRRYPFQVVYNKQTEFFNEVASILPDLNSYITEIDVWLGEQSSNAPMKEKQLAENNQAVIRFYDLIQKYFMYLPERLLEEANHLHSECMILSNKPDMNKTYECINLLFSFMNSIREFVGIEKLSKDFLKAFSQSK
jgi:hypothetical protein